MDCVSTIQRSETDIVAQGWEMESGITMYEMPELHGALEGETEVFVLCGKSPFSFFSISVT